MSSLVIIIIPVLILIIFLEGSLREKRSKEEFRKELKENYGKQKDKALGKDDLLRISGYHHKCMENAPEGFCIDEITWNDLSMDDIFMRLNSCYSSLGEEELYHRLHCPILGPDEEYDHFCKMREYFEEHEQERIKLQEIFNNIGINRKTSITKIYDYVSVLKPESNVSHYIMILFVICSVISIFIIPGIGVLLFLAMLIVSIGSYLKTKKVIEPLIVTFNYTGRMIVACEKISEFAPEILVKDIAKLKEYEKPLRGLLNKTLWISSGAVSMDNPVMLLLEYIKMVFHIDLIMINDLTVLLKEHIGEIDGIRYILGSIDAAIAVGSYKNSLYNVCIPEFIKDNEVAIDIEDCIHPLVAAPVSNSIKVKGAVLVTGSNASGKSTFLKTLAVSALFAQTLGFVPSKTYRASRFKIFTSMALNDSISNGESYFIVEIKSIKRIIDAGFDAPVLCCIDEVLRGTNTVERIAASTQILRSLVRPGYIVFAATHDIELTKLLKEDYINYHFEEVVSGNDIKFNYLLQEGSARTRNAIKLLKIMGYEENIIHDADDMVERFINTGNWSL
ncbi:MAG: hypothetical protein K6E98_03275 [Lachnospiraceae bacterium]|nr:hypothetical protein [Lachnospiraceae bacterium]